MKAWFNWIARVSSEEMGKAWVFIGAVVVDRGVLL
jgi:hypothetical protein